MRDDNVPLPQCEGPKLDPFPDSKSTITFRRLIGSGGHAYVFEATIDSTAYALKLVSVTIVPKVLTPSMLKEVGSNSLDFMTFSVSEPV